MMHTVLLGAPVGDRIRTWDEEGPRDWLVDHPETLAVLLGRGQVSRTEVEPSRFREAGLLAADEGVLLLPARFADKGSVESAAFRVRAAESLDDAEAPDWAGFGHWLNEVTFEAALRGEFVVVERGGWTHCPHPYALFLCHRSRGQWVSVLETAPAPQWNLPPWMPPSSDPRGHTVTAPATSGTLRKAGSGLAAAILEWARSPADVALTFATAPDGPWPGA
jgi:hypothetical protein